MSARQLVAGLFAAMLGSAVAQGAKDLDRQFAHPPLEARPWVYWWFEGGYGDPQGMARDIAAMREKGIGGVMHMQTINAGGLPVPKEPKMLSPEWDAWFGEALSVVRAAGLSMSASILDGWSHGGWWVGKEDGAKQLVYSETQVEGPGALSVTLPQPPSRIGVYRDVAVVAFKENTARPAPPLEVRANNVKAGYCDEENWPAAHAVDGDPETFWRTGTPCSPEKPAVLDVIYAQPMTAAGALIAGMPKAGPAECELQVSDDGKSYRPVAQFNMNPGETKRAQFAATTAPCFRLSISRAHVPDLQLAEFQVLRQGDEPVLRHGIKWWDFKSASRAYWQWPPQPYEALEEEYPEDGASDLSCDAVVDLSDRLRPDGRLDWEFPAGRWTVLRFGWTAIAEQARMGSGGYEVDVLNTKGADLMMNTVARRMRDLSVKRAGGAPIIFHTDSWEIGAGNKGQQPTWTDDFRDQFKRRRGYDLLRYFPALARRIVDDRQTTDRFLWDYRATVADLLTAYYGRLQERAHEMNGGINSESGYGSYPHPHMDGLQIFGRADRPMAEFWHPFGSYSTELQQLVDVMRTTASGARIYGRRIVQAETLTFDPVQGVFTPPEQYRRTLHEAWARGLNQAVIHKYTHQPSEAKPGMLDYDIFNRQFSWWPLADGFIGYMGRSQYLLQQGEFVADAAYFVGEGSSRFVPGKAFLNPALPAGYDYDGINAEVLSTRSELKRGRLVLTGGPSYSCLVLCDPQCVTMTATTLGRIHQLVEAGLVLVGKRPSRTPGLSDRLTAEAQFRKHADALWGASPGTRGERRVGKGRTIWGEPLAELLAKQHILPDCEAAREGKPFEISWLHRRSGSDEIYFLANPLTEPVDVSVTLRAKGKSVRLCDPLDGSIRDLPERSTAADGRTRVPLHFEANQAFFLILDDKSDSPARLRAGPAGRGTARKTANFPALKSLKTIEGPWSVSFDAAWVKPLPPSLADGSRGVSLVFDPLVDWTKRSEEGIKGYSGLANYRNTFDVPKSVTSEQVFLELGTVKEMARVLLNGRDLGVVWCPPWRVGIPDGLLKENGNELLLLVANTWNNRLCADAALPAAERLTRVGHHLHEQSAKRGLQPAGLIGPVRVVAAE
jgi:hypothetical protein